MIVRRGEQDDPHKEYKSDIINFMNGESIIALYGRTEQGKKRGSYPYHFVTLGFVTNQCSIGRLTEMAAEEE